MFGPHLALDCYQCDQALLEDLSLVYETLDQCPDYIGMTKIMPPYVFRYSGTVPEDWGVSGVVLIAESHISIHTFPEKRFMSVDIFSCKCFDVERAVRYVTDRFGVGHHEQQLLDRGRHFPKTVASAGQVMDRQRLISGARGLVRARSLPHETLAAGGCAVEDGDKLPALLPSTPSTPSEKLEMAERGNGKRETVYGEPD